MSVSDKEISSVGDSGVVVSGSSGGDDHDDDDDDDDEEKKSGGLHQKPDDDHHHYHRRTKQRAKRYKSFSGFSRNLGEAKKYVLRPFKTKLSGKSKSHNNPSSFSGKRIDDDNGGGDKGCCFCFTTTPSGESAAIGSQSQNSDPNHPTFTYDMLRVLIEKSDFYSKECNTHLDPDVSFGEE